MMETLVANLVAALVFSVLGIVLLLVSFLAADRLTPFSLWHELIEEHNTALAVVIAAVALGLSLIIAAAIH